MITPPTLFENHHMRKGATIAPIVELTDGSTTWYFSTTDLKLQTGHVYPLLADLSDISESLDIYSKEFSVSSVNLTLKNAIYRKDSSGNWIRLIDDINGITRGHAAKIYLLAGSGVTGIGEALPKFDGYAAGAPEYDADNIRLTLVDKLTLNNIILPKNTIADTYSYYPPIDIASKKMPLVYGDFSFDGDDTSDIDPIIRTTDGTGLAKGYNIDRNNPAKSIIADHVLDAFTNLFIKIEGLDDPGIFVSPTLNTNDSGRGTATADIEAYLYFYPMDGRSDPDYNPSAYGDPTDYANAFDRYDLSYAQILDSIDAGSNDNRECYGYYVLKSAALLNELLDAGLVTARIAQIKSQYLISGSFDSTYPHIDITTSDGTLIFRFYPVTSSTSWQNVSEQSDTTGIVKFIVIHGKKNPDADGDGTVDNAPMLRLYEMRLRVKAVIENGLDVYAECKGREYGSWISGRSSNYSSGDCIEDPAGIIESILRDILSFSSSNIDQSSFIDAENTSVKSRINLHSENEMSVIDIITQLAIQSTFAFHWSAAGSARLIPLNDNTPTTDRIIPYSHLVRGQVKIYSSGQIINRMTIKSRFQQEYGNVFKECDQVDNSASQTTYNGTYGFTGDWPNICSDSRSHVINHYIKQASGGSSNGDGIWANDHRIIEFETPAFTNADLEIGDWIEFEASSVDGKVKFDNASWSGKQFLIIQTNQTLKGTRIKAIKLF